MTYYWPYQTLFMNYEEPMPTFYISIAIIQYPGSLLSAVYGLEEMFEIANSLCSEQGLDVSFSTQLIKESDVTTQQRTYDLILLPPSTHDSYYLNPNNDFITWLKEQYSKGAICATACAAAFILAEAQLIKNTSITTHWRLESTFRQKYPHINLKVDAILINEGQIITAGGMMSWMDLGFEIVTQFTNVQTLRELGRYLVIDTSPREQRYYAKFIPPLNHGDEAVLALQHHIHAHFDQDLSIQSLMSLFHFTQRTLHRRFIKATGYNPSQYIQRYRVQKACQLLETTHLPFESIAFNLGYQDANALRKKFVEIMGLSPKEFKNRFHLKP
ncbi:GlxA family transcriptional regulator [Marinomonas balearica]|uniref:Transcriptional regulator GlxA family with amidase domain n=1 Tax=Marinomonas balearica TaxID=491947 RepID=A0A4R6MNA1_9GAMM|nr:helix-turn-helix domain-containing protein [Marinomonas balearica]TDP01860.1 transcriptional regulator GlxA family with amidase domain [Marinomonas balearica]